MVKISEELFVSTINAIKEGIEQRDEFEKALSKISDSYFITNIGDRWLDAAIKLLEDAVGDEVTPKYGSTISWWLWENIVIDKIIYIQPEHKCNNTGKNIELHVNTPEELYNYFKNYT